MAKSLIGKFKDTSRPKSYDWFVFAVVFLLGFLFFSQFSDINLTVKHSRELLSTIKSGGFFRYYSIVLEKALSGAYGRESVLDAANYNILIYLVIAVWFLPLAAADKLFNIPRYTALDMMHAKLLIALVILLSAYLLYRLALKLDMGKQNAEWTAYLFLSSPVLIFGSILFTGYDVFSCALTLLALFFYVDKKYSKFTTVIAAAACFKIFALFIFIPLILIAEKRIARVLLHGMGSVVLLVLTRILTLWDSGYSVTQQQMDEVYRFKDRLFESSIAGPGASVSIFLLLYIIICIACYMIKPPKEKLINYIVFICLITYGVFFAFVRWHPQWAMLIAPFAALAVMGCKDKKLALIVESFMCIGYVVFTAVKFTENVDNYMITSGPLSLILDWTYSGMTFGEMFVRLGIPAVIPPTVFVACLCFFVWYVFHNIRRDTFDMAGKFDVGRSVIWVRAASLMVFILPSFALFFRYS